MKQDPDLLALFLHFLLLSTIAVGGTILLTKAYREAPPGAVTPLEYTALIWDALWGLLLFSEVPDAATIIGALVIPILRTIGIAVPPNVTAAAIATSAFVGVATAIAGAVALATHNATDPSLSTAAGGPPTNWIGALVLTALFIGSTRFTEQISISKYPEYRDYQARVSALVPWWPKRG